MSASVSGAAGIPLFYDWVFYTIVGSYRSCGWIKTPSHPYSYQSYTTGALLVCMPKNMHILAWGTISYMHTYNYFRYKYNNHTAYHTVNKTITNHLYGHQLSGLAYCSSLSTQGTFLQKGRHENLPVPGRVEIKHMRRHDATVCAN